MTGLSSFTAGVDVDGDEGAGELVEEEASFDEVLVAGRDEIFLDFLILDPLFTRYPPFLLLLLLRPLRLVEGVGVE